MREVSQKLHSGLGKPNARTGHFPTLKLRNSDPDLWVETGRNDRIVKVERRALIGAAWRFEDDAARLRGLLETEHAFVERLNLTIRQGSAYLFRADDLPRAMEGASRRSPGVASLLLQSCFILPHLTMCLIIQRLIV